MSIFSQNDEYTKNQSNWKLVRDLIKGESALKRHDWGKVNKANTVPTLNERYLPMPQSMDCGDDYDIRYYQYIQRASLFNAVKRTEQGMAGMVYSKPSKITLPKSIEYIADNVDGSGVGIEQQSTEVLNDVLETGREGLFVDFPQTDKPVTKKQAEDLGIRSYIAVYKAESILDWDSIRVNGVMKLSFVKLKEKISTRSDDYLSNTTTDQIRVLLLIDGVYVQRVYDQDDKTKYTQTVPKDKNSKPFDYIPFFFIGSINNRPNVDPAPLIELAEVNLAHYRNSADFEESSFIVGQPTLVVTGLNQAWVDDNFAGEVRFGSRGGLPLPKDSDAKLIQADPNIQPKTGMDMKENQMVELGARLITSGGGAETAEAARIKHSADASVLSIIVRNINQAYNDAINTVLQFMTGSPEQLTFEINMDFFASKLSGPDVTALVQAWQGGAISKAVLDDNLKAGGVIFENVDLEEMNSQIENEPSGLPFT